MSDPTPGPLAGELVVDLSSGIAGAYATALLAGGGADVVIVEPPDGHALRRWSASGAAIGDGADGALFTYLSSSKRSMVVDPDEPTDLDRLDATLARAGAVVWSAGRLAGRPEVHPTALLDRHPHLTVTAISPFGIDSPWADRPATELTLQAWSGGVVGLGRGSPDRAPVFVGGQIGEWLSGAYAAIGTLAAGARARTHGPGELVDVSMLETMALCLTYEPVTFVDLVGRPFRTGRSIVTPGVERTSDGLVGTGVGTGQQWLDFCVMVGHPEWMEDRKLFADRGHLRPQIAAWMAEHTTAEVLDLAGTFRIPHAPIGNGATIPGTDHFAARGAIVPNPRDGFGEPAPPYRFDPPLLEPRAPAPAPGEGEERRGRATPIPEVRGGQAAGAGPYEGLRVLDLTSFWAGPLCTNVLALLGAEVIHVESTSRPDGTRLLAGLRFSEPDWWERSGIFCGLNAGKLGLTLDLSTEEGRLLLRRVVATCDVVVENSTPRVLDQLGLGGDELHAIRPDLVVVRMPGFGLDGPWRDRPAFAFVIEDAAGLTWMTGHRDDPPVSPYCVGDSNAGTHAVCGLLLALEHRRRTGEGVVVEASMVDAALSVAGEAIVEHAAYGALLGRDGNRGPTAAPQGLYLTADGTRDSWVAISVATDEQWRSLVDAIGTPSWASDGSLATEAGRRAAHDDLDVHLSAWCASRPRREIVDQLWGAGVPVGEVIQPHEQASLAPFQHRGFFEEVDRAISGPARHRTLPYRSSRHPRRLVQRPAPLLGEHTGDVLRAVGVDDDELARLADAGVIGTEPTR